MAENREVGKLEKIRTARKIMMSVLECYPKEKKENGSINHNSKYWIRTDIIQNIENLFSLEADMQREEAELKCEEIKTEREEFTSRENEDAE